MPKLGLYEGAQSPTKKRAFFFTRIKIFIAPLFHAAKLYPPRSRFQQIWIHITISISGQMVFEVNVSFWNSTLSIFSTLIIFLNWKKQNKNHHIDKLTETDISNFQRIFAVNRTNYKYISFQIIWSNLNSIIFGAVKSPLGTGFYKGI